MATRGSPQGGEHLGIGPWSAFTNMWATEKLARLDSSLGRSGYSGTSQYHYTSRVNKAVLDIPKRLRVVQDHIYVNANPKTMCVDVEGRPLRPRIETCQFLCHSRA